jgi:hypothetical protein
MPIPAFTADGLLPAGVHDCTLEEVGQRFGAFKRTDARCRLFERLEAFVTDLRASGLVVAIIVNGSFVTDKDAPGDIDLILVTVSQARFPSVLRPMEYNALSKRHVRRKYGFDILLGQEGQIEIDDQIEFFSQVREQPDIRKGLLRIWL